MRGLLMALVLAFATASALAIPAKANGRYAPDNNGKITWQPDANGNRANHVSGSRKKVRSLKNNSNLSGGIRAQLVTLTTAQGCTITVHAAWAGKFSRFFSLLKDAGYKVPCGMVGCYSPGHKPGSNHRIGGACDIQRAWNKGPAFVYHMASIVKAAGLYDGCSFGDCGHVEAIRGLHNKAPSLYAAVANWQDAKLREATP